MTVHLEYAAYHDLHYTDHPGLPVSCNFTAVSQVRTMHLDLTQSGEDALISEEITRERKPTLHQL